MGRGSSDKSLKIAQAMDRLIGIEAALDCYYSHRHEYPSDDIKGLDSSEILGYYVASDPTAALGLCDLKEFAEKNKWLMVDNKGIAVFLGPWGNAIHYRRESPRSCMIWDVGPNGKDEGGKGDDISRTLEDGE
jgi:hypothetical protein